LQKSSKNLSSSHDKPLPNPFSCRKHGTGTDSMIDDSLAMKAQRIEHAHLAIMNLSEKRLHPRSGYADPEKIMEMHNADGMLVLISHQKRGYIVAIQ
jgi:hypothetical protein